MPYYTPCGASVNSELRLLEFRVTGAPTVPDFQNLDAPVPIVVEDSHRAVSPHEVNLSCSATYELAIICECFYVEVGEINVFFQDLHVG